MVEVNIPIGTTKVTASPPLYQWDYGQKLRITGNNLPLVCKVHFCNKGCKETIVRIGNSVGGNTIETVIPDSLLACEWDINAFIYVEGEECGNTIYQIIIPVNKRKKPEDFIDPIPEDVQKELEKMIVNVNGKYEEIEEKYNQTITYDELEELMLSLIDTGIKQDIENLKNQDSALGETIEHIQTKLNEEIEGSYQDEITLTNRINENKNNISTLQSQVKNIVNGYPFEIKANSTHLYFNLNEIGVEKTITLTPQFYGNYIGNYSLSQKKQSGSVPFSVGISGNYFLVQIGTNASDGVNTYRIYVTQNESVYIDINVEFRS